MEEEVAHPSFLDRPIQAWTAPAGGPSLDPFYRGGEAQTRRLGRILLAASACPVHRETPFVCVVARD
jgi:hypothetical protein